MGNKVYRKKAREAFEAMIASGDDFLSRTHLDGNMSGALPAGAWLYFPASPMLYQLIAQMAKALDDEHSPVVWSECHLTNDKTDLCVWVMARYDERMKTDITPKPPAELTMSGDDVWVARRALGMTQLAFARALGLRRQMTISEMELGDMPVSERTEAAMRLLLEQRNPIGASRNVDPG